MFLKKASYSASVYVVWRPQRADRTVQSRFPLVESSLVLNSEEIAWGRQDFRTEIEI
jgi:hypothetical protein